VTEPGAAYSAASHESDTGDVHDTPATSPPRSAAVLWAETLQTISNLVAHDFRNSLNAVAVNLEVVRGRSARGAEASAIAPFASTAAEHYETAAAAAEALLALARPEAGRVDVAVLLGRLSRLIAVGRSHAIEVTDESEGRATAAAPADMVRAIVARSVLVALGAGGGIACAISVDDGIFLRVTGATHVPPLPDSELVTAAGVYGIRVTLRGQTLELRFPAAD
jgi:hypothetical protein